jgi:hypothetical protein
MTTQIITTSDQDADYQKVITITHGAFTMEHWVATLSINGQQEWRRLQSIHEDAVHAAVAAGDAEVLHSDTINATIKWRNQEIHSHWMNTISVEDRASYNSFWTRYQSAEAKRK